MNIPVVIVFIVYIAVMIGIGFFGMKKNESARTFYLADGKLGKGLSTGTFLGTYISAVAVLGYVGYAYAKGFSVLYNSFGCVMSFYVFYFLFSRVIKNKFNKMTTIPDIFEYIFDSKALRATSALVTVILYIALLAIQIQGGSLIVSSVLGIKYATALILITIVFIVYTVMGGMVSVVYTDLIQSLILTAGIILSVFLALGKVGGLNSMIAQIGSINPPALDTLGTSYFAIASTITAFGLGIATSQYYLVRVYSAKNLSTAKFMIAMTQIIWMVIGTCTAILGICTKILVPNLTNTNYAYIELAKSFHPVFQSIILISIVSAIMSTTDSVLLVAGTYLGRDIFQKCLKPTMTDSDTIKLTRYSMIGCGVISGLCALNPPEFIISLSTLVVSFTASCFFAPMVCGFFWKRTTKYGAMAGIIAGGIAGLIWQFSPTLTTAPVIPGVVISFVVIFIVSLAYPKGFARMPGEGEVAQAN